MLDVDTATGYVTTLLTDYSTIIGAGIVSVLTIAAALLGLKFLWRYIKSKIGRG